MSAFFAIDLEPNIRAQVKGWLDAHRVGAPKAKWVASHKWHLTVLFVGHPAPSDYETLVAAAVPVLAKEQPFRLRLSGSGTFTTRRAPAVLWFGTAGDVGSLERLHRELSGAVLGQPASAPYRPHVTLARGRDMGALETLATAASDFESDEFTVRAVTFYESTHAEYRAVASVPLR